MGLIKDNVVREAIVPRAKLQTKDTIFNKQTQLFGYADDIDIIGRSLEAVLDPYQKIERFSTQEKLCLLATIWVLAILTLYFKY
jgi:hypothetical protein